MYQKRILNGVITYRPEIIAGSQVFDGPPVSSLPENATAARVGSRVGKLWTPEGAKRTLNLNQFGTGGTRSIFKLSCDFRPAEYSHAQWRSFGFNMLSKWTSDKTDGTDRWQDVPEGERLDYSTEGSVFTGNPRKAGHYFYTASLADMEQTFMNGIPAYGPGAHWTANIEETNYWVWDYYDSPNANYPPWNDVKGMTIQLESQAGTMTLEQLRANTGMRDYEQSVRRSNRNALMLRVAGRNGAFVSYGSSMYQGEPRTNALNTSGRFLDEADINVNNAGGSNNTITLNGRQYAGMTGSFYKFETCHLDYHYYFTYDFTGSNYDTITDYPTLWLQITNRQPFAREVGHWMANRKRIIDVHGTTIPVVRMHELFYEDNFSRTPIAMQLSNGDGGTAKTWVPPYLIRMQYMASHILEGERLGSGYHIFHAAGSPSQGIEYGLSSNQRYNHHLHTVTALVAARRDMETILDKLPNTTLTCDLQIKFGNSGDFQNVNGVTAYAFGPDGDRGTTTPCAITRHRQTSEGLYVLIAIAHDQGWNDTRTDVVRIPGIGNGNTIKVTYKGKDLQVFEVLFPTGVSNTEFLAQSLVSQWQKPGYGGRVNNN